MRPLGITNGRIGQLLTVTCERLQLGSPSTLAVVSNAITISKSFHKITSAVNVNVNNINGGQQSDILVLMSTGVAIITLKDGVGNLALAGDCKLDGGPDTVILLFDNSLWVELCRSNN